MKTKSNVRDLTKEEIDSFLKGQKVGTLALTDGKTAYAIPLAYSYDEGVVYLTLGGGGRKAGYIEENKDVCFSVHWLPSDYGSGGNSWKSVICDGELVRITNPEGITKAIRVLEKHMGRPANALDNILTMTLKKPMESSFWSVKIKKAGGRGVENFKEEFSE
ncbi:MAG: hypothetical protein A3C43_08115 [Candidatus Schekmanbacteria bacterium RIFCSPHIGHO2_02_FULL_38_11]|uniref:Pyridoxamine 5'-phosphate oxidase putative domain-containing protein n=1 Tax=Candidatus Schekmanbacteria bacterium RIFCSPLOWO2_12_FULL_38_15 TaxID=1817883 RepID=A0A1F7SKI2_9BACT|nr:MAG: hypothetical protein A3H37_04970 [Candidatus Schekmanbacteria bacterium RIFCSPLOWO2_02_FULL_38_14]OGL51861.1 MAG: hypothetical protein A3C43_08115 [Candidatus Schekmanbacteria bacterium RIFCSPHIGHO2_02_FULL_38_11]OGL54265.1 MAG: hypothetical protein A3G31_04000 [Candidatus Schekmanbacteria bacterium RIFCSPLOWO2_12_FULL_38_15]